MKVSFTSTNVSAINPKKKVNNLESKTSGNPALKNARETVLPGFSSIGTAKISFAGRVDLEKQKKEIAERNKKLQADLDFAEDWSYSSASDKYEEKCKDELKGVAWYKWGTKSEIKEKWQNRLDAEYEKVMDIRNKRDLYIELIKGNKIDNEKLEEIQRAYDTDKAINERRLAKGGLDDKIASYQHEKDILFERFCVPIEKERQARKNGDDKYEAFVPPSQVLYGATGTGKTTFINALAHQTGCQELQVETTIDDFEEAVREKLEKARDHYFKTGNRTIVIINEAEDFIGTKEKHTNNVRCMKSILDNCSKLPEDKFDEIRSAASIFVTTNYPQKIHKDIRDREGKIGELLAINPPEKADIEAVLKHHIKIVAQDAKDLNKKEGTNRYLIDPESIPYSKIAENKQPTDKEGAFSNDKLEKIVLKAFEQYKENPEKPFFSHLGGVFVKTNRDIDPIRYKEFKNGYKEVEPRDIGRLSALEELESMGLISDDEKNELELLRQEQ